MSRRWRFGCPRTSAVRYAAQQNRIFYLLRLTGAKVIRWHYDSYARLFRYVCPCRLVFGRAPRPHSDLNLPQRRNEPAVEPEEQHDDLPAVEGDLSVSRPSLPPSSLPPALSSNSSPSSDQVRFRPELRATVQVLTSSCAAPDRIRPYEAVLEPRAPKIAEQLGLALLPMVT